MMKISIGIASLVLVAGVVGCQGQDFNAASETLVGEQTAPLAVPAPDPNRPDWEAGMVLVKWRDDAKAQVETGLAASLGLSLQRRSPAGVDKLALLTEETVPEAVERLSKDPRVIYAEPNYRIELTLTPNDSRYADLWGMNNTGQTGGTYDCDIDAPEAWDIATGSSSIIVALLDTGVDYTHPDLVDNIWTNPGEIAGNGIDDDNNGYIDDIRGWNFEGAQSNDPMDTMYHGTHCAGTIGGTGNNGQGVVGVNWHVSIMPLRIIGNQDLDAFCLDAAEAVIYATDNGARVMSCSWWTVEHYSQTLENAVGYSDQNNVLMVVAAANNYEDVDAAGTQEVWPCEWTFDNTLCVAATDHNDAKPGFSNWGASSVDVAAPGVSILSTFYPGHGYDYLDGTSMATPHTAGLAALILSVDPSLTAQEVKQVIMATGDDVASMQGITTTGKRINAFNALAAVSGVPLPPVANAGPDQNVDSGVLVNLDGSNSFDPNQEPITYAWTLTQRPAFSSASLDDPTSPTPTFVADFCGEYVAELVVTDPGNLDSNPDEVHVYAQDWSDEIPNVETGHPYGNNENQLWTITRPGADFISVHFASFDTESGYDYVYLLDGGGTQVAVYNGSLGEFIGATVPGDTVQIHFTSDGSVTYDGFVIDGVFSCSPPQCPPGQADCNGNPGDGCEVYIDSDVNNCGGCGTVCPAPAHATPGCSGGTCGIGACNNGWANCDGQAANGCETDLQNDVGNCGGCGNVCQFDNAGAQCSAGTCQLGPCDAGFADCNGDPADGCEVDTRTDVANCGACDWTCSYAHGVPGCQLGSCQLDSCNAGWDNCDGVEFNGCEADLNNDPTHCSACGMACPDPAHGAPGCASGDCGIASCDNGWDDCDGQDANGCEASIADDPTNCGSCGQVCTYPNASGECVAGACGLGDCQAPYENCDGQAANGCEVSTLTDPANCGGCGQACAYDNGIPACQAGACQLDGCVEGYADCDNMPATGCEISIMDDLANCGGCDQACGPFDNASANCEAGACSMGACDAGFADCNAGPGDGCEADVTGDPANCGACGQTCGPYDNASPLCQAGACGLVCDAGYADCNNDPADGCEVSISDDLANCGTCGQACDPFDNAGAVCQAGACSMGACDAGFADCDANPVDGCETGLGTDDNCAACGDDCGAAFPNATGTCGDGACQIAACDDNYDDCDSNPATGCETALTGVDNCGACGQACAQGESCIMEAGTWTCSANCADADADGFADQNCGGQDCNDDDAAVNPGAQETCNQIDDNCDGETDEGFDADGDGVKTCDDPADCDDANPGVHPGATEICDDGVDQDCNGGDLPCDCPDADADGHQDASCGGTDCNDADATINPDAAEVCEDGIDQDCDGEDEACGGCEDADGDGHEDAACGGDDCDDSDANTYPGAEETCGDDIDQDCNGQDLSCDCPDADGDGYTDYVCGGDDCYDSNADVNPGATEKCGNNLDDDCDGLVDDADDCEGGGGGGCGCAASGSPRGALAGLFGLLALVGLIRRRRS